MLGVEEHEIAAGVLQQIADAGGDEFDDEMANFDRALARHLLQTSSGHPRPPSRFPLTGIFTTDYTRLRSAQQERWMALAHGA